MNNNEIDSKYAQNNITSNGKINKEFFQPILDETSRNFKLNVEVWKDKCWECPYNTVIKINKEDKQLRLKIFREQQPSLSIYYLVARLLQER